MTPAEELRAAADRLDKLAGGATQGPWRTDEIGNPFCSAIVVAGRPSKRARVELAETLHDADAAYIAAMNPLVGKALVKAFRDEAEESARYARAALRDDGHPALLALARLINGGETDG